MKDTISDKKKSTKKVSVPSKIVSEKDAGVKNVSKDAKNPKAPLKKNTHLRHRIYLSYGKRLFIYITILVVSFTLSLLFARKTLIKEDTEPINYTEKETIDYKVYLKENDFYTDKYLSKDKAYIASLIDYIDIDLSYTFSIIERLTKMNVNYKVIAELVIENTNGSNRYYEKEYVISDTKTKSMKNTNELLIFENVKIDYGYYNQLANKFRSSYGVDTNSYLKIYILLDKKTDSDLNYSIKDTTKVDNVIIPLSQRAIEIKINSASNLSSKFVIPTPIMRVNIRSLIGEVICFLISVFALIKVVKYTTVMIGKITVYDRYVNRLLKDYDRLIIEIDTSIDFNKYNVIEVSRFNELLDVRDNVKMPINYYNITKHEKGIFFIKNNDDVYLLTLKNTNLIGKNLRKI